ncbi:hypothetical protein [Sinorhizobium medicae]|uniref:hypothetical protein n=1 Tax=Sinorhizobium medicae TaxID=110321 RepID=UPI00040AB614|nr:hypothetical protein [Sinorhizobium medicae]RVQ76133.1 helix-turn-helix domain containing protein [Sinorhizobium medicae]
MKFNHDDPDTPAHIAPFVEALGADGAVDMLLEFGGSQIHLSRPDYDNMKSAVAERFGKQAVGALAKVFGAGYIKVPLGRQWIAQVLFERGTSLNEIARTVRADVATVRRWGLKKTDAQLDLEDWLAGKTA